MLQESFFEVGDLHPSSASNELLTIVNVLLLLVFLQICELT